MTDTDILAGLAEIVQEMTGIDPSRVQPKTAFHADLDIDSLSMVEVVVAAEERFGVRIPDDDATGLVTVGDAIAYVRRSLPVNA